MDINDYTYHLPDDRIANVPLAERDKSKLLVYRNGGIVHSRFDHLGDFLPDDALLFFNDTRVIPARLVFTKETGASIEIFLLSPHSPQLVQAAMESTASVQWHCTIGNVKRWPDGKVLEKIADGRALRATRIDSANSIVELSWSPPSLTFADILLSAGATPLPPYIKRQADVQDASRYQTVYSHAEGAVAAPTAGLHFSTTGLQALAQKGIKTDFLTLHVSAGTFQPVKAKNILDHNMHTEQIIVTRKNIENLLVPHKTVVAVGTTSLRTLESLYWFGVRLINNPLADFDIQKLEPYQKASSISASEAFKAVAHRMGDSGTLAGQTSILIMPGYKFQVVEMLITNFHQPGSTLMLLVAAFVGEDWRKIYAEALGNSYRFLSYGDSSVLTRLK